MCSNQTMNSIKPFNAADLRKFLTTNNEVGFTALSDSQWIKEFSASELEAIISRADDRMRQQIGGSRLTPPPVLAFLARDSECDVRCAVAGNPNTPAETLNLLARRSSELVPDYWEDNTDCYLFRAEESELEKLLSYSDLSQFVHNLLDEKSELEKPLSYSLLSKFKLANSRRYALDEDLRLWSMANELNVRCAVAGHPNSPAQTLNLLARDRALYVRCAVARNPKTPAKTLNHLARDSKRVVRKIVAGNPNTPAEALDLLVRDSEPDVRSAAAKNGSASGNCFIATAATGSYQHPITATLRTFRDVVLEKTPAGRLFIQSYYRASPPIARKIAQRPVVKFAIKWLLLYPLAKAIQLGLRRP